MPETFKLLINENIWSGIKTLLEEQGYDVCAVRSECPGMKDRDIILKSAREERVILTQDHDFGELVYRHECKPYGFVFFRILPNSSKRQQEVILGFFQGISLLEHSVETPFLCVRWSHGEISSDRVNYTRPPRRGPAAAGNPHHR